MKHGHHETTVLYHTRECELIPSLYVVPRDHLYTPEGVVQVSYTMPSKDLCKNTL